MSMGQASDGVAAAYDFIEDFIFWKNPDKTLMLMKEAIKLPIVLLFVIYLAPIRLGIIVGLWGVALSNSPFFESLAKVGYAKVRSNFTSF